MDIFFKRRREINKKGISKLAATAYIIAILSFFGITTFWQLFPFNITQEDNLGITQTTSVNIQKPPFDFSKVSIVKLVPIRNFSYNGSNNIVCYFFNNPTNNISENFTLIGEWFIDTNEEPEDSYKQDVNYDDLFRNGRLNWYFISSNSENANNVRFRLALRQNVSSISNETTYPLKFDESLLPYLRNENEGSIKWDNSVISEFIKKVSICDSADDKTLAQRILDFTRNWMNQLAETSEIIHYDNETLDSMSAWYGRVGTSSEYSVVYAMLLRIVGIPAKLEINNFDDETYYYVKYYSENKGWVPVDVYGKYNLEEGCLSTDSIKKGVNLTDICIPSLKNYVEFREIEALEVYGIYYLKGIMVNKFNKSLDSYCIKVNINFYDSNDNKLYNETDYLSSLKVLEVNKEANFDIFIPYKGDYDYLKIELDSFNELCN